jgi:hypothetical protein
MFVPNENDDFFIAKDELASLKFIPLNNKSNQKKKLKKIYLNIIVLHTTKKVV